MRGSIFASALLFLISFTPTVTAIESLPNSPCAVQCGNVLSSTTGSDIVCQNADFTGTSQGVTFAGCVTCQLGSTYVDPVTKQTDLQWGLYNLRYAMSWCLFGYPNNTAIGDSPCVTSTACGPLENAFEFDSLSPNASEYGYCALMNSISLPKCSACLQVNTNEFYLVNFVTALNAACQQQPVPGSTIAVTGSLFSTTPANITAPSSIPTGTYTPSTGVLTLGAKIGIAVGGILLLLGITGFSIIWFGKRRRRRALRERQKASGYDEDWRKTHDFRGEESVLGGNIPVRTETPTMDSHSMHQVFDSPQSTRPLNSWAVAPAGTASETPIAGPGEKSYVFGSNYNSPVSAVDQVQVFAREWPIDRKGSFRSAHLANTVEDLNLEGREYPIDRKGSFRARNPMSAVDDLSYVNREWPVDRKSSFSRPAAAGGYPSRSRSRDKEGSPYDTDRIEMQNVAPVLKHPGHGRGGSIALTEDDMRRGNAV